MPKLWSETIDAHRHAVREATLNAAEALIAERGLQAVTMLQIAAQTGIGRATLYKYFPDIKGILLAWHDRRIASHLAHLTEVQKQTSDPLERLEAVLRAYALMSRGQHHGSELAAFLHRGEHVARAHRKLHALVRDLVVEGVQMGGVRADVSAEELASYCLHALGAASGLKSKAAIHRLVVVTLAGLRDPR